MEGIVQHNADGNLEAPQGEILVSVKHVSKKFCRHLRRSMAYLSTWNKSTEVVRELNSPKFNADVAAESGSAGASPASPSRIQLSSFNLKGGFDAESY